jgi:hypothetical protein
VEEELRTYDHGCLLGRKPARVLVCFVPVFEPRWWHRFIAADMQHCFALKHEGGGWILFEPWQGRLLFAGLTGEEYRRFERWGRMGTMLLVSEHIPGKSVPWRGLMSCAVLLGHLLGRSYWVWTPRQLYRRLISEVDTEVVFFQGESHAAHA